MSSSNRIILSWCHDQSPKTEFICNLQYQLPLRLNIPFARRSREYDIAHHQQPPANPLTQPWDNKTEITTPSRLAIIIQTVIHPSCSSSPPRPHPGQESKQPARSVFGLHLPVVSHQPPFFPTSPPLSTDHLLDVASIFRTLSTGTMSDHSTLRAYRGSSTVQTHPWI